MTVIELTSDTAEAFVARNIVGAILFYTPGDPQALEVINEFRTVADTFVEPVGFGLVDLTAAENVSILKKGVVVLTPTMICYRLGKPMGEYVGHEAITRFLDHDSIVHSFGHTDTWLKLLR